MRITPVNQAIAHKTIQATQLDVDEAWHHRFFCFFHFTGTIADSSTTSTAAAESSAIKALL
jgi:hypothetical protein